MHRDKNVKTSISVHGRRQAITRTMLIGVRSSEIEVLGCETDKQRMKELPYRYLVGAPACGQVAVRSF